MARFGTSLISTFTELTLNINNRKRLYKVRNLWSNN